MKTLLADSKLVTQSLFIHELIFKLSNSELVYDLVFYIYLSYL
jgi:hypothetical protein